MAMFTLSVFLPVFENHHYALIGLKLVLTTSLVNRHNSYYGFCIYPSFCVPDSSPDLKLFVTDQDFLLSTCMILKLQ